MLLAIEVRLNNAWPKHIVNNRDLNTRQSDMCSWTVSRPMTRLKLAIARSNSLNLLKIRPHNTTYSALHKHEWINQKPKREWRRYKCHETYESIDKLTFLLFDASLECHYDENCIFSVEAILKNEQVALLRRKMLFIILLFCFCSRDIQVFKICKLAIWWPHTLDQILIKCDEKKISQPICFRNVSVFAVRLN